MAMDLQSFKKNKDFLVCIDSDGCAIDSMNIKHFNCFGPEMVGEWKLEEWQSEILERWNYVNLFSLTRGINRFKGLLIALTEVNEKHVKVEDLDTFAAWVNTTNELSNNSLARAIESNPESICLKKALSWSNRVNASIKKLPEEDVVPFGMVKEALIFAHEKADIAIVSSANLGARLSECLDQNRDHKCDLCSATVSVCTEGEAHECELCGKTLSVCADADLDHKCDVCDATLSECLDGNPHDHKCDVCGVVSSECTDENNDHFCDICKVKLTNCEDNNSDHECELCGKTMSVCADNDRDHKCDICSVSLSSCSDITIPDHKCDLCSATLSECSYIDRVCPVCGDTTVYKHVVVIGVDGAGSFFKETSTPNMDAIFADGAITYEGITESPSSVRSVGRRLCTASMRAYTELPQAQRARIPSTLPSLPSSALSARIIPLRCSALTPPGRP